MYDRLSIRNQPVSIPISFCAAMARLIWPLVILLRVLLVQGTDMSVQRALLSKCPAAVFTYKLPLTRVGELVPHVGRLVGHTTPTDRTLIFNRTSPPPIITPLLKAQRRSCNYSTNHFSIHVQLFKLDPYRLNCHHNGYVL